MGNDYGVRLYVWGDYACFTRPEMKAERVSYDVMTPSAARGILEAVFWKPAIRWHVDQIEVHTPIRFATIRRNEVAGVASARLAEAAMSGRGDAMATYVEEERQQRASLVLREVAYTIHAHFELTADAAPEEKPGKFLDMFRRRAEGGQCFHRPYLGCREFSAYFAGQAPQGMPDTPLADNDRDLGWMLHDFDFSARPPEPRFFRARLENGRMNVPPWNSEELRA